MNDYLRADIGDLFPIAIFVIWILGSIFGGKKKLPPREAPPPAPQPKREPVQGRPPPGSLDDILREIERELGKKKAPQRPMPRPGETNEPIIIGRKSEEPARTRRVQQPQELPPQPIPTPRGKGSREPKAPDALWHQRKASETTMDESWHQLGDSTRRTVTAPKPAKQQEATWAQRAYDQSVETSAFVKSILSDLGNGGNSVAKAVVLREILGPPLCQRDPYSDEH